MVNRTNICASCPVGEDWFGEQTRILPTIRKLEILPCLLLHFTSESFFVSQFCLSRAASPISLKILTWTDRGVRDIQPLASPVTAAVRLASYLPTKLPPIGFGAGMEVWYLGIGIWYSVFGFWDAGFCISCSSSWLLLHMVAKCPPPRFQFKTYALLEFFSIFNRDMYRQYQFRLCNGFPAS